MIKLTKEVNAKDCDDTEQPNKSVFHTHTHTHTHKADKYNVPGISCYGINGHKKGEVDHVYILNKAATQQEVGAGHAQKKCCLC